MTTLSKDYLIFQDTSNSDSVRLEAFIRHNQNEIRKDTKKLMEWKVKNDPIGEVMVEGFQDSIKSSEKAIKSSEKAIKIALG